MWVISHLLSSFIALRLLVVANINIYTFSVQVINKFELSFTTATFRLESNMSKVIFE